MSAYGAWCFDVSTGRLADAQPVEREQGDEALLDGWPKPGGHEAEPSSRPVTCDS